MVLFCLLAVVSGCSLLEIHEQTKLVESIGFIKGNIKLTSDQKGDITVLRFRDEKGIPVLESHIISSGKGEFLFSVVPGEYYVAAFIDSNKDENSPIVVPSWRDVEPESEFLKGIHSWNWHQEIPYHLAISYIEEESGDGVVPLESQAPLKLQSESIRMYAFNNDHSGTFNDNHFLDLLNRFLKKQLTESMRSD